MFSKTIVKSEEFSVMPKSSQALYFHLGMEADDDGFVHPGQVMRSGGYQDDDLKILLAKRFLLTFESGVVVIKHWLIHNLIQKDRHAETRYKEELNSLFVKENKAYTDNVPLRFQSVNKVLPQVRLGKVSIDINTILPAHSVSRERIISKKKAMKTYDENSSYEEKTIDLDTREDITPSVKATTGASMKSLLNWSEQRREQKFGTPLKQFAAFKRAKAAKISPSRLQDRWCEMEADKFWSVKGFDWSNVVMSFDKRP